MTIDWVGILIFLLLFGYSCWASHDRVLSVDATLLAIKGDPLHDHASHSQRTEEHMLHIFTWPSIPSTSCPIVFGCPVPSHPPSVFGSTVCVYNCPCLCSLSLLPSEASLVLRVTGSVWHKIALVFSLLSFLWFAFVPIAHILVWG